MSMALLRCPQERPTATRFGGGGEDGGGGAIGSGEGGCGESGCDEGGGEGDEANRAGAEAGAGVWAGVKA